MNVKTCDIIARALEKGQRKRKKVSGCNIPKTNFENDNNEKEEKRVEKVLMALEKNDEKRDTSSEEDSSSDEEKGVVYENNLHYYEDSLSIMTGMVDTRLGKDCEVWITTDSGSMTQLCSAGYADKMKFRRTKLDPSNQFSINGPGGGRDDITECVELDVKVKMKKETVAEQTYEENESTEEIRIITMTFGICQDLPVPILWGGGQMREHGLLDYHDKRTLSIKTKKGVRYSTSSMSWMAATAEMKLNEDHRIKAAIKDYLPSKDRLSNMVAGERRTINLPAVLYPGRDNVVRVGRQNAKIDEGYNTVVLDNEKEIYEEYGHSLTVIESVSNGEAFVVVRNNSTLAIRIPAGKFALKVIPAICLPSISTSEETDYTTSHGVKEQPVFKKADESMEELHILEELYLANQASIEAPSATKSEQETEAPVDESEPLKFWSWNMNGLVTRVKLNQLKTQFYPQLRKKSPDVICLQEVKLKCAENDPSVILQDSEDEECWKVFFEPLQEEYDAYMSLSEQRYAGQIILVKKKLEKPEVCFNMGKQKGHFKSGRFISLTFKTLEVLSIYVPFNGVGKAHQLERRKEWDLQLREELQRGKEVGAKPRVLIGDMNVAYKAEDLSPHPKFWFEQGSKDVDFKDRGFGGTTEHEIERFTDTMEGSGLQDTLEPPLKGGFRAERFTFRGTGMFMGKGMRIDYCFVDWTILASEGVKYSEIRSDNILNRTDFMGSDHLPIFCELQPNWTDRRSNMIDYDTTKVRVAEETTKEDRAELDCMFKNTHARDSLPKMGISNRREPAVTTHVKIEVEENLEEDRPEEFPSELWEFVEPDQRGRVKARFMRFRSKEYLEECIEKVLKFLDIYETGEVHTPKWMKDLYPERGGEGMSEEKLLRAQAVANLDIFFFPDPEKVDLAKDIEAEIITTDNRPCKCRSRKLSVVQQAFLQAKTNVMLKMKQLEHSSSDWCHGLVLVPYEERMNKFMKEHGDEAMEKMFLPEHELEVATFFRLCIDLRMLNAKTIPDRFPIPRIDDLLESIPRNCGRYSLSDVMDAFFKCKLKQEHRYKTAFKTHDRHLQFSVLPMGYINSPGIFCRLIARTFEGMDRSKFSAYIDDILNHTDDFAGHMDTQQEVYNRMRRSQLTLKLSKTHLNYTVVKFLGHILTKEGRMPDPQAVEAIVEWADPTSTKEVRSFLGATLYYREYIYNYADMAMPLYELIRKGVVVEKEWDPDKHGDAVRAIKEALTSKPVLMQVDNTKPFRLKVDACRVGRGIGCILEQKNDEGKWQPVSFFSSSLSKEERNYSATELECKALHDCILHYAVYLKYIPFFEVFSDHCALKYMVHSESATTNGRLMRYLLDLQEFNFAIYYRRGTENCDADAVSRLKRTSDRPVYLTEDELSNESGVITPQLLQRARKLDARNKTAVKESEKVMRKMAKQELKEMSIINDHILAEGVENLESESGRKRFFENLQKLGLQCSRETVDKTISELQGKGIVTGEDAELRILLDAEEEEAMLADVEEAGNCPMVNLVHEMSKSRGCSADEWTARQSAGQSEVKVNAVQAQQEVYEDVSVRHEKMESALHLPILLCQLTEKVKIEYEEKEWLDKATMKTMTVCESTRINHLRDEIVSRCEHNEWRSETVKVMPVAEKLKKYNLRSREKLHYDEEVKIQPNWKETGEEEPRRHSINEELERSRRKGAGVVEVRDSLVMGDSGCGLFAVKKIKSGTIFTSYEGVEVPEERLNRDKDYYRDYVASAVTNHKTKKMIYIDSIRESSCYGRYAQDPIDEQLVNAKILWRDEKLVLVATTKINPGDEIYLHYGLDYWKGKLSYLDPTLRQRIEARYEKKAVRFESEVTVARIEERKQDRDKPWFEKKYIRAVIQKEGEALHNVPVNYRTTAHRHEVEFENWQNDLASAKTDQKKEEEEARLEHDYSFENVNECEELAQKVAPILNGRKYEDEGRLYEIYQVRYLPKDEMVIGFRKPLSGRHNKEDGSAFAVYGKEGLYELSERYLLEHPEDRNDVVWPENNAAWADWQDRDELLGGIKRDMLEKNLEEMIVSGRKIRLVATSNAKMKMLIRVTPDKRKGVLEQTMVPEVLKVATLRMHHEGFGHLGANRMLETMRLRYFWSKMDQDVKHHTGKCVNCKLRKTYQRKPKVPIMKYTMNCRPLDRVHVDLTGPLPLTKGKHRYIMVIKDYLTKYVWLIPLKTKTAVEVAEAFVGEFICLAGVPDLVVSDRGNEFVNQLLKNVARVMGINRVSTTPYNPRSDGFVENHNKTLKDQLFHFIDTLKQDDWDVYLPTVQLMYNTTVSLATGYTPMLLMTGREARMPSFSHLKTEEKRLTKDLVNNEYVLKMIDSMRGYQDFAIAQTEKNKDRFNVRVRQPLEFVEYEPDQKFLRVRRPTSSFKSADAEEKWKISMKLLERYEGPYKIIRKISPVLYDAEVEGVVTRVHAGNMKPY
jgi:exodeoxyribonuclease III